MLLPKQADRWQVVSLEWAIAFVTAAMLILPRASLVFLGVFAVTASVAVGSKSEFFRSLPAVAKNSKLLITAAAVLGWALLSAIWSVDTLRSLMMSTLILLVVGIATVAVRATNVIRLPDVWFLMRGIVVGFLIGLAYLVIEEVTDRGLMRAVLNTFTFLKGPTPALVTRIGDHVAAISPPIMNRNLGALSALFWPALFSTLWLSTSSEKLLRWRIPVALAVFAVAAFVIFFSGHESSKLALALSAVVFAAACNWPQKTKYAVMAMWVGATLLMVPTVEIMDRVGVKDVKELQRSGRDRIYIWTHTARQFYKSPIIGIGAAGTPIVNTRHSKVEKAFAFRLNRHAHNMYLQNAYELGAIGAVLLCLFGLVAINALASLGAAYLPFGLAQFSAIMGLMAVSYGMWQFWLISAFAISAVVAKIAANAGTTQTETL